MLFPSSSQVDVAVNNVLTLHLVGDGVVSSAEKKDQQQIRKCFSGVKLIIKHRSGLLVPCHYSFAYLPGICMYNTAPVQCTAQLRDAGLS